MADVITKVREALLGCLQVGATGVVSKYQACTRHKAYMQRAKLAAFLKPLPGEATVHELRSALRALDEDEFRELPGRAEGVGADSSPMKYVRR